MSLWGGPKALELLHNSALCNQKTSKNLLLVLKDYCNDNELYNELSCNKGTFDDEIDYYLGKADQDNESHKVCNKDVIAKSYFDDLRANNSLDNINIHHSSSSTSSNDNSVSGDIYSDNLLVSEDVETDHGNLLVSGDIDNDHCSHDDFLVNGDTSDDHNQSYNDEHILFKNDNDFLGSGDLTYSNESINIDDSLHKCESLGSGERIQIDNLKTVNDDKSVNIVSISNNDSPYEGNFLGSGDSTLVQAVVPMKGLDVCLMEEDNLAFFEDEQLCNLRDFIVNDWPNSKTDIPVSKLCHWFLQDELVIST